ncbi:MAG TPA: hypothetical protein PKC14_04525 [Candidatus Absconditabacterales bacterium]|nr:hypothetical protein [Candidatus Absconditabacterales bacterium]
MSIVKTTKFLLFHIGTMSTTVAIEKKLTPALMNKTIKEIFPAYKSGRIIFLTEGKKEKKNEIIPYPEDLVARKKAMKELKEGKTFNVKDVAKELGITL